MIYKETNRFYLSRKWKNKRASTLKRDGYQCKECKRYGKVTPATTVHHVYPYESFGELKLHSENLISLCNKCHNSMHDRVTNELTEKGKQWTERLRDKIF